MGRRRLPCGLTLLDGDTYRCDVLFSCRRCLGKDPRVREGAQKAMDQYAKT